MEELLTNAFSTGDLKVIIVAVILYLIIFFQRKDTKIKRDDAQSAIETRMALIEADNKLLHTQLDTIGNKLDKIIDQLSDIRVSLANKKDKD